MKQATIFLVMILTLGLASCSQGNIGGGDSLFGSLLNSKEERDDRPVPGEQQASKRDRDTDAGSQVASGGSVIGGITGSRLAASLNPADQKAASEAEYRALEYGKTGVATPWRNPQNGKYGNVVASKPFKQKNIFCRQYTHTVYINGRPEIIRGIACRNRDGSWQNLG